MLGQFDGAICRSGVLALDSQPPAEAVAEVLALDEMTRAWVVNLPPAREMPAWMGGAG